MRVHLLTPTQSLYPCLCHFNRSIVPVHISFDLLFLTLGCIRSRAPFPFPFFHHSFEEFLSLMYRDLRHLVFSFRLSTQPRSPADSRFILSPLFFLKRYHTRDFLFSVFFCAVHVSGLVSFRFLYAIVTCDLSHNPVAALLLSLHTKGYDISLHCTGNT